jgi:hypothetical protein
MPTLNILQLPTAALCCKAVPLTPTVKGEDDDEDEDPSESEDEEEEEDGPKDDDDEEAAGGYDDEDEVRPASRLTWRAMLTCAKSLAESCGPVEPCAPCNFV